MRRLNLDSSAADVWRARCCSSSIQSEVAALRSFAAYSARQSSRRHTGQLSVRCLAGVGCRCCERPPRATSRSRSL